MISLIPIRCRKPCKIIKALYSSGGCFRIEPCDSCTKRKTVLYLIAYNHKFALAGIALRKALTVKLITNPDFLALEVRIQTLHPRISRINYATDFYLIRTFYYKASRFASSLNDRKVYCLLWKRQNRFRAIKSAGSYLPYTCSHNCYPVYVKCWFFIYILYNVNYIRFAMLLQCK